MSDRALHSSLSLKAHNLKEENKILKKENLDCLESSKMHTNL